MIQPSFRYKQFVQNLSSKSEFELYLNDFPFSASVTLGKICLIFFNGKLFTVEYIDQNNYSPYKILLKILRKYLVITNHNGHFMASHQK